MMNFVAICLVVSSLAAAGVWSPSPSPEKQNKNEDLIVKEGHRVVIVEYDQDGKHNTKVSISPSEHDQYHIPKPASPSNVKEKISSAAADALNSAKDKIKEASSVLPNLGQGLSGSKSYEEGHARGHGPGELICDAYGNCEHKIASSLERAKDKVSRAAHGVAAQQKRMAHEAKDVVSETAHEVIDKKKEMAYEVKDIAQDAYGKAKDTASEKVHGAKEAVQDAYGKAKETASEKAYEAKEVAKDALGKARETASQKAYEAKVNIKDAGDTVKTMRGDIARNLSEEVENVRDTIVEAKEGTVLAGGRLGRYFCGLLRYMRIPQTLNSLMAVINLLGFSTAYGMGVWVTFISSYVLAGAMPRHQFGMLQSKIYPVYFRAMACSIGLALLGHMPRLLSSKAGMFQGFNLLATILMVFINSIYLEPLATKVMFERMKFEKEEERGIESQIGETSRVTEEKQTITEPAAEGPAPAPQHPEQEEVRTKMVRLSERLKKLNIYSSVLNIITLMSLSWHLVYLGQSLHTTCY